MLHCTSSVQVYNYFHTLIIIMNVQINQCISTLRESPELSWIMTLEVVQNCHHFPGEYTPYAGREEVKGCRTLFFKCRELVVHYDFERRSQNDHPQNQYF